jgi:hypothetical protein
LVLREIEAKMTHTLGSFSQNRESGWNRSFGCREDEWHHLLKSTMAFHETSVGPSFTPVPQ